MVLEACVGWRCASSLLFSLVGLPTTFEIGALCPYCMVAWFGTFLILSSVIQELLRLKSSNTEDFNQKASVDKINGFMPIFHVVWLGMVIGAAFLGVN